MVIHGLLLYYAANNIDIKRLRWLLPLTSVAGRVLVVSRFFYAYFKMFSKSLANTLNLIC